MATRDTGGQSQAGKSRREEIEETTAEVDPAVAERAQQVSEEGDDRGLEHRENQPGPSIRQLGS